jgi:hypothetical protein
MQIREAVEAAGKEDKDLWIRGIYGIGFGGVGLSDFVWGLEDVLSTLTFLDDAIPTSTASLQASM